MPETTEKKAYPRIIANVIGRIGKVIAPTGKGPAKLSVAVGQRVKTDGVWQDGTPIWLTMNIWEEPHRQMHAIMTVGQLVQADGILTMYEYEGKQYFDISVSDLAVLSTPKQKQDSELEELPAE